MQELLESLRFAERKLWLRLLTADHLLSQALKVASQSTAAPSQEWLTGAKDIWYLLAGDEKVRKNLQSACSASGPPPLRGADADRLHRNASRFFAATIASFWLTNTAGPDAPAHLARWLSRMVGLPDSQDVVSPERLNRIAWSAAPGSTIDQLVDVLPLEHRPLLGLWLRFALGLPNGPVAASRRVPIASYDDGAQGGTIYDLELARLGDGPSGLVEAAALWNRPIATSFLDIITAAFTSQAFSRPVVWSLTPRPLPNRTIPHDVLLSGTSHTAASRVAFYVLAHDLDYDPGCLISAKVTDSGDLDGVFGLKDKCDAAFAHENFNRVVIATTADDPKLTQAVIDGYKPRLTVLRRGTLADAVEEATGLPAGIRRYLQWVRDLPDQDPPPYLGNRHFADLYIEPDVLRVEQSTEAQDNRGGPVRAGGQSEYAGQAPLEAASEAEELAHRYQQDVAVRARVPWRREWARVRRAVILGYPGEGKTVLARMTVRDLARRGLDQLDRQEVRATTVTLPVCLRLADVGAAGNLERALRSALKQPGAPSLRPSVVDHLVASLPHEDTWLVLDGLDEVAPDCREAVKAQLVRLREASCRIILTTRPYGYNRRELPFAAVTEYQLAPLNAAQRRRFLAAWFPNTLHQARAERVRSMIQGNASLTEVARNALLLTLACAVGETRNLNPHTTRRKDLYYWMVRDLIRGAWKENPRRDDDASLDEETEAIQRMALELFQPNPAQTLFPIARCRTLLSSQGYSTKQVTGLLNKWTQHGLLLYAVDPTTQQAGRFFLHRTFLEYLAAAHAATLPEPVAAVRPYLWQSDGQGGDVRKLEADEFITFLASCLPCPTTLIEHLIQLDIERPDGLRAMLRLASACLSEVDTEAVNAELVDQITSGIHELWRLLWWTPAMARCWAHPPGVNHLIQLIKQGQGPDISWAADSEGYAAIKVLGMLGSPDALPSLVEALQDEHRGHARRNVAEALGELGDPRAVPELIKALDDPIDWVREGVVKALGQLGDCQAAPALLKALKDRGQKTPRQEIAAALGQLGNTAAVPVLIRALERPTTFVPPFESESLWASVFDEDEEPSSTELLSLQCGAAKALGSLRDHRAVTPLLNALQTTEYDLRRAAAEALRELDDKRTLPALLNALQGNDPIPRPHAAEALGVLGDVRAVPALINALEASRSIEGRDYWLPPYAVKALGMLGDARAVPALIKALENRDWPYGDWSTHPAQALGMLGNTLAVPAPLRALDAGNRSSEAADALGALGGPETLETLIDALRDERKVVREQAARALGALGNVEALPALLEALWDEDICMVACQALGMLSDARAIPSLFTFLEDECLHTSDLTLREASTVLTRFFRCPQRVLMVGRGNVGVRIQDLTYGEFAEKLGCVFDVDCNDIVGIEKLTDSELAEKRRLIKDGGVLVTEVFKDSPGERAKLKGGDVIVSLGGNAVKKIRMVNRIVGTLPRRSPVELQIIRETQQVSLQIIIDEGPNLPRCLRP